MSRPGPSWSRPWSVTRCGCWAICPSKQLGEKAANAVGILALVAGQDVEPAEDSDGRDGRWRITQGTAYDRMVSTVDPEARHVHKTRTRQQDGYKAHLATEPETGLYTAVALRPGAGPEHHEAEVGIDLLADEDTPWTPSATPPTPPATPAKPWNSPGTGCFSSLLGCGPPSPAVSPSTTSPSTPPPPR
ncbi:hypothetical protein ACFV2Z_23180 [Streptomyces sp. NPDC059688]|uniref:hypothetical protein n=1 Tax=Streptomyces sp. NPDC059688 TaxID=3346906 RepID=UPI0036C22353